MKILIYGGKGWIGQQFCKIVKQTEHQLFLGTARANNKSDLINEITEINPTHLVSFIGRTHGTHDGKYYSTIDYLEQPGKLKENVRDNLYSPIQLALLAKQYNIHYTYLGTGCIFKYDQDHPFGEENNGFNEQSEPNFFGSGYSTVKGFTDQLITEIYDRTLNLRIRMPISDQDNPRNFITKITHYAKICSVPNSMTVLPELLPLVIDMMKKDTTGTLNLTNPGLISHNEILEMYKEYVDPYFEWENFTVEEQSKILAADRSNNFLDTTRLVELYPSILPIKESVRNLLQNYQRHTDLENSEETVLLVTGGCGFIGSNFINFIMDRFDKIRLINIDALYYCANIKNVNPEIRNSDRYNFINGNICSIDLVRHIFKSHSPTHVVHFAAQSHVQTSFADSLQYTHDNIVGTHTLLEVARLHGSNLKKFIHVSTDEVYGESMLHVDEQHKTEQSILCPTNPYAATKAGAELIAQAYNHSFKMPIIITRGNNVYGENQYPEKLIPLFIKQLQENEQVTIQGDGSQVRAFLHVDDVSKAFQKILEKGKIGEIYNIGSQKEYSVKQIAEMLVKMIKETDEWIRYIDDRPFNDKRYYISNEKLKKLGWKPKIKFEDGIKQLFTQ